MSPAWRLLALALLLACCSAASAWSLFGGSQAPLEGGDDSDAAGDEAAELAYAASWAAMGEHGSGFAAATAAAAALAARLRAKNGSTSAPLSAAEIAAAEAKTNSAGDLLYAPCGMVRDLFFARKYISCYVLSCAQHQRLLPIGGKFLHLFTTCV